jgi:hypothetical protein
MSDQAPFVARLRFFLSLAVWLAGATGAQAQIPVDTLREFPIDSNTSVLIQAPDGNAYALTSLTSGDGSVLRISPAGQTSGLVSFHGTYPTSLVEGGDGRLSGSNYSGRAIQWGAPGDIPVPAR